MAIEGPPNPQLAGHGLRVGARIVVDHDAPLRGPRIIRLRGTQLALPRSIVSTIRVIVDPATDGARR